MSGSCLYELHTHIHIHNEHFYATHSCIFYCPANKLTRILDWDFRLIQEERGRDGEWGSKTEFRIRCYLKRLRQRNGETLCWRYFLEPLLPATDSSSCSLLSWSVQVRFPAPSNFPVARDHSFNWHSANLVALSLFLFQNLGSCKRNQYFKVL